MDILLKDVFEEIYVFKDFIYIIVGISFVIFLVLKYFVIDYDKEENRNGILVLFFDLTNNEIIALSCVYIKVVFLTWVILSFSNFDRTHYVIMGSLFSIASITCIRKYVTVFNIASNVFLVSGLFLMNLISDFLTKVRKDGEIEILYWSLGILIVSFSVYVFLQEVMLITNRDRKNAKKEVIKDE